MLAGYNIAGGLLCSGMARDLSELLDPERHWLVRSCGGGQGAGAGTAQQQAYACAVVSAGRARPAACGVQLGCWLATRLQPMSGKAACRLEAAPRRRIICLALAEHAGGPPVMPGSAAPLGPLAVSTTLHKQFTLPPVN